MAKCLCNNCSGHLEFDECNAGQHIDCPHCGMETLLYIPQAAIRSNHAAPPPRAEPAPPPMSFVEPVSSAQSQNLNLRQCPDCRKEVSIHAESCPHCGAPFVKKAEHGVFYYVFWGVISLIGTCLILLIVSGVFTGTLAGILAGAGSSTTTTTPKLETPATPLTEQEKQTARSVLKTVFKEKDKVTGTTFLTPKWANEKFESWVYCYIGITEDKDVLLRVKVEYKGSEMLIIRKVIFRIDDTMAELEPDGMAKTDYVAEKHWEWFDLLATRKVAMLERMGKGNNVIMRYKGASSSHDRTLLPLEKQSLREFTLLYRYLRPRCRGKQT